MDKQGPASLVGATARVYGGLDQTHVCPSASQLASTNLILSSIPESYTVKHRRHHVSQCIIDACTVIPIVNGTISVITWVRIHPHLHLPNRCLPLLPQARIVQMWRCGVLQ